jgi:hypothetical protein
MSKDDAESRGKDSGGKLTPERKAAVDAMLRDRIIDTEGQYAQVGKKASGVTDGAVFSQTETDKRHLLKKTKRSTETTQDIINRRDNINEFVMAGLYKRLLYDRASTTEITKSSGASQDEIFTRIKFFENFKTLTDFTGARGNGGIATTDPKLQKLEGFEKVIAACMVGGEADYHASNLGVITTQDASGQDVHTAVKIDHGRSAIMKYSSESSLREALASNFEHFRYTDIPFDVRKFKDALDEMTKISEEEIKTIVGARIQKLKDADFQIKNTIFPTAGSEDRRMLEMLDNDYEKLEQHYVGLLTNNLRVMKELSKTLDIIDKIDFPFTSKNKLLEVGEMDPVLFAIYTGYTIEGKDPIAYAAKNNIKIDGQNPILYAVENDKKIDGKHPMRYAVDNHIKIEGKEAIKWIMESSLESKKLFAEAIKGYNKSQLTQLLFELKEGGDKNKDFIALVEKQRQTTGLKFDRGSDVYQAFMSQTEEELSQKLQSAISKISRLKNGSSPKPDDSSLQAIIENCPADLLDKLVKINDKIDEKVKAEQKMSFKDKALRTLKEVFSVGYIMKIFKGEKIDPVIQTIHQGFEGVIKSHQSERASTSLDQESLKRFQHVRQALGDSGQKRSSSFKILPTKRQQGTSVSR